MMWGRIVAALATAALILGAAPAQAAIQNEFISTWDTTKTAADSSDDHSLRLPLPSNGTYNFDVDWGDGSTTHVTAYTQDAHTYAVPGIYTVKITNTISGFNFTGNNDRLKLLNVSRWGPLTLGSGSGFFSGAENMNITATDAPNLSQTTSLNNAFSYTKSLTDGVSHWDTSQVTDLSQAFANASAFNENLDSWDTSHVTSMYETFYYATKFNGAVGNWDVSNVTNMNGMFEGALTFNQDISRWQLHNPCDIQFMFSLAYAFNQDISAWNTSNVTNMTGLFQLAKAFNRDISAWNTSNVTRMEGMFAGASAFNQNLGPWDVRQVTNMSQMMRDSGLRPLNYDKTLISWAAQDVKNSVAFWGNSKYASDDAVAARAHLTGTHLWNISDGGRVPVPAAPSAIVASPADRRIAVTWTDTPAAYYVPVDLYTATASPGGHFCTATSSGCILEGLTNGQAYTVKVTATSAAGTSNPSAATAEVVPIGPASAPQTLGATPGHRQLAVAWAAPDDLGGSEITGYLVRAEPGGATCSTTGLTCTLVGLGNATSYRITVHATTGAGPGRESALVATTEPAWPQTATPKVAKKVKARKTVLLKKVAITNAGQRAAASVKVRKKLATITITPSGKVVLKPRTHKGFTVTLFLSAPATDDYAAYSYHRRWKVRSQM
jgi:surface protein